MFLPHTVIERYIEEGLIIIGPAYSKNNLRPVGLRMHLGRYLLLAEPGQTVDLTSSVTLNYKEVDLTQEDFYLQPGQFVLGSTYETIQTARTIVAFLDGRSTIARLGLTTHITASIIDGTYEKPHAATLEIKNVGGFTIRLQYKDPIAMMLFAQLQEPVTQKLQSQYTAQPDRVTAPNLQFKTGQDV